MRCVTDGHCLIVWFEVLAVVKMYKNDYFELERCRGAKATRCSEVMLTRSRGWINWWTR